MISQIVLKPSTLMALHRALVIVSIGCEEDRVVSGNTIEIDAS